MRLRQAVIWRKKYSSQGAKARANVASWESAWCGSSIARKPVWLERSQSERSQTNGLFKRLCLLSFTTSHLLSLKPFKAGREVTEITK